MATPRLTTDPTDPLCTIPMLRKLHILLLMVTATTLSQAAITRLLRHTRHPRIFIK